MLAYTVDVVGSVPSSLITITATLTTITAKQNSRRSDEIRLPCLKFSEKVSSFFINGNTHTLFIIRRNSRARDTAQPLEARTHKQISKEIIPVQWHV